MAKDKELSDLEAWKARADYLDGIVADVYKSIHHFLKEIVTPLHDNIVNINNRDRKSTRLNSSH
jgi:hypothetical protein